MMAALDIEYVELHTSDMASVVDYFVSSLGVTPASESAGDSTDSVLLRQGVAQIVVTTDPGTWKFLDIHGDGVADIRHRSIALSSFHSATAHAGIETTALARNRLRELQ
jgi:4-hydroxymandelate synthase